MESRRVLVFFVGRIWFVAGTSWKTHRKGWIFFRQLRLLVGKGFQVDGNKRRKRLFSSFFLIVARKQLGEDLC